MNTENRSVPNRPVRREEGPRRRPENAPRGSTAGQGRGQGQLNNGPSRRPTSHRRRRRRRSRTPQLYLLVGLGFVILLILSMILTIHSCVTRNPIVGKWSLDQMTSYVFYEEGNGALVVPRGKYTFDYTLDGNILSIDFHDENALDSNFEYEKDGDTLTLVGGNKDVKGTYELKLQE